MTIFHIVSTEAWDEALITGSYRPESLASEGFIHFSHAPQVAPTANRYYRDLDGLQVVEVDPDLVDADLREEPSPATGELFPHLYGPLPVTAARAVHPLRRDENGDYRF